MGRGMAEAIGRSANTIAGYMGQAVADDADARRRHQDRLEEIRLQAELRDKDKEPALTDDQLDEETAGLMGTTVADVRATRNAVRTGDMSAFKVDNDYPPGFEEQFKAKTQALYKLRESVRMGKDYQGVAAGRATQQQTDHVAGIVGGAMKADDVSRAHAAVKGEGAFKGTGDTVYDQFSGDVKVTPVGQSQINKNNRPDASAAASERASQRAAITQERIAADNEANRLRQEKADALKTAYSQSAKDKVNQDFAERERAVQARLKDIADRLRAIDEGESAPARPAPARSSGGFTLLGVE